MSLKAAQVEYSLEITLRELIVSPAGSYEGAEICRLLNGFVGVCAFLFHLGGTLQLWLLIKSFLLETCSGELAAQWRS